MDPKVTELYDDTRQAGYDETVAMLSWQRTINFFNHILKV